MTPNWFEDGKNILTLGGITAGVITQFVVIWRNLVTEQRVSGLTRMVSANDAGMLAELSSAKAKLDHVMFVLGGGTDRRQRGLPLAGGRRRTDPPRLLSQIPPNGG